MSGIMTVLTPSLNITYQRYILAALGRIERPLAESKSAALPFGESAILGCFILVISQERGSQPRVQS